MCHEGPGIPQVLINTRKACLTQTSVFLTGPKAEVLQNKTSIRQSLVTSQPVFEVTVSGTARCARKNLRARQKADSGWAGLGGVLESITDQPPGLPLSAGCVSWHRGAEGSQAKLSFLPE